MEKSREYRYAEPKSLDFTKYFIYISVYNI